MSEPQIVFLDAATYGHISLRRFLDRWDCAVHSVTSPSETRARLPGRSIAVTNKVAIDEAVLQSAEARDLRLIAVAATGTDIIDCAAARRSGIAVCNVPGYATESVAQFTMALILELATRVGRYERQVQRGEWQKSPVFALLSQPTFELRGKRLGIIGYGNIGMAVARMAQAFGMEIRIAARVGSAGAPPEGRVSVEEVFREADVLSLHCPLSSETRLLVNRKTLDWMKPSAFLINTARGALVDEAALLGALTEGRLAGAALDVLTREPPPPDHPVLRATAELDNLIVTPHTAWSALEARQRLLSEIEQNIAAFVEGQNRNRVV